MNSILNSQNTVELNGGDRIQIAPLPARRLLGYFQILAKSANEKGELEPEKAFELGSDALAFLLKHSTGLPESVFDTYSLEDTIKVVQAISRVNFPEGIKKKADQVKSLISNVCGVGSES